MSDRIDDLIQASEPAAWERLATKMPITYRVSRYTRDAHRAGFEAGLGFAKAAMQTRMSDLDEREST